MAKTYRPIRKGVQLSDAIQDAYASAPADVVILHTLEFIHPSFRDPQGRPTTVRVVRDPTEPLTATLEADAPMNAGEEVEFQAVYFNVTLPSEEDGGSTGTLTITVDNAGATLIPYLEQASESDTPIEVIYRPYVSTDLTAPDINPPLSMYITNVDVDLMSTVTAVAGFGNMSDRRFPYVLYKTSEHPGLSAR